MKPSLDTLSKYGDALTRSSASLGVTLDAATTTSLLSHLSMVLQANETMNLTRISDPEAAVRLHIVDSLAALGAASEWTGPIVDLGAGAGYPGIPIAIVTGQRVILCESIQKKARFLAEAVQVLGLDAVVVAERAETYAVRAPASAQVVVARAVTALPSLVELASPLLRRDGLLVAMKGSPEGEEIARGRAAAGLCGMQEEGITHYALPGGGESRSLFVYRRTTFKTRGLPRREGLAQRSPLA